MPLSFQRVFISLCFLVSLSFPAASVFADDIFYPAHYTVSEYGSTDLLTEFFLDGSKPWLYIQGDGITGGNTFSRWWFASNNYDIDTDFDSFIVEGNQAWVAFQDIYWDYVKKEGDWEIVSSTDYGRYTSPLTFFTVSAGSGPTVTPEPLSALLFVSGGGVLAFKSRTLRLRSGRGTSKIRRT